MAPQDQPIKVTRAILFFARMWSTTAPMSRITRYERETGLWAAGGASMACSRVEKP